MSEPLERLKVRIVDTGRECYDREYCVWDMLDEHKLGYKVWEGEIIGTPGDPVLHRMPAENVYFVALRSDPKDFPVDVIKDRLRGELAGGIGAYAQNMLKRKGAVVITNSQWVEDRYATYQFVKDVLTESVNL